MAAKGFAYKGSMSKTPPSIRQYKPKAGLTVLHVGDLVNLESGLVDLAASDDISFLGVVIAPGPSATAGVRTHLAAIGANDYVQVIIDPDAIYADPNDTTARVTGATLDISGATGAQTLATSSNADVVVVADSSATQPTLFKLSNVNHAIAKV